MKHPVITMALTALAMLPLANTSVRADQFNATATLNKPSGDYPMVVQPDATYGATVPFESSNQKVSVSGVSVPDATTTYHVYYRCTIGFYQNMLLTDSNDTNVLIHDGGWSHNADGTGVFSTSKWFGSQMPSLPAIAASEICNADLSPVDWNDTSQGASQTDTKYFSVGQSSYGALPKKRPTLYCFMIKAPR